MSALFSGHNKRILEQPKPDPNCPLGGKCQATNVIYQAEVTRNDNDQIKHYICSTKPAFKNWFNNHTSSIATKNTRLKPNSQYTQGKWKRKANRHLSDGPSWRDTEPKATSARDATSAWKNNCGSSPLTRRHYRTGGVSLYLNADTPINSYSRTPVQPWHNHRLPTTPIHTYPHYAHTHTIMYTYKYCDMTWSQRLWHD